MINLGAREFEGGKLTPYTTPWGIQSVSINSDIFAYGANLRNRSRWLRSNNEHAAIWLNRMRRNILGPRGIQLQNGATRPGGKPWATVNNALEAAWKQQRRMGNWDVTGRLTGNEGDRILLEQLLIDGEFIAILEPGYPKNQTGFAVRYIDIERLDYHYNAFRLPNGNRVVMSVEIDDDGRPVAYHILDSHPEAHHAERLNSIRRHRYPAERVLHGFVPMRPEQIRGIPFLHACIIALRDLGAYREAAIIAARFGARKLGGIRSATGNVGLEDEITEGGDPLFELEESGLFKMGPEDDFVKFDPDYPHEQFGDFNKALLRGIASYMGVSYHALTGDLESVNFATGRLGSHDERDTFDELQYWFTEHVHDVIGARWLEVQLVLQSVSTTANRPLSIDRMADYWRPEWRGRGRRVIEPLKESQDAAWRWTLGTASLSEMIRDSGRDPDAVFTEIAADKARLEELGIPPRVISQLITIDSATPSDDPDNDEADDNAGNQTDDAEG